MKTRNIAAVILASIAGIAMFWLGMSSRPKEPEKIFTAQELPPEWKPEVIKAWELVPLADSDGRVKSLHTFAYYELLRSRAFATLSLKVEGDKKNRTWSPMAWLLDCFFHPQQANNYPSFVVEDSEVLTQLGITPHEKQRDRYSYNELLPGKANIMAEYIRLSKKSTEEMSRVERLTNVLARNFIAYGNLVTFLDAARSTVTVPADVSWEYIKPFAGRELPALKAYALAVSSPEFKTFDEQRRAGTLTEAPDWMKTLMPAIAAKMNTERDMLWYPPREKGSDKWVGLIGTVNALTSGGEHLPVALSRIDEIVTLAEMASDPAKNDEFQSRLLTFANARIDEAKAVDVYGRTASDRTYLKWRIFEYTKWAFIVFFLLAAVSWLKPNAKGYQTFLKYAAWAGLLAIAVGIGQRVWITGWGPVTTIYETIPYITLMAGVFAMLMSRVIKNVLPVSLTLAIGAFGMFLASRHEVGNSEDTLEALQAVLRSNYWLWTHVTSINLGYATVLLAAIFSMIYIFARMFDIMRTDGKLFRDLTRCSYGILCFGLFFALIGTILGGIWGNDSWGRFWGWDPKENGAMLICLWCLFIMHMRLGGWIKEFGLHIWTALGAIPVIFSWWHVNQLQVGLHSYGFTEGLDEKLVAAYTIVGAIVAAGVVVRILESVARKQMAASATTVPAADPDTV